MDGRLQVFTGNAHPQLAADIMRELEAPLGRAVVGQWRNGESRVKLEENVRGSDVFIIQSMSEPANHHLMEMLMMIDAARRASAARITAVIPYYAYAKQEKKTSGREPISAKLVANLIVTAGADRVLTVDLHAPAIEGFFDIPVDHLRATPLLAERIKRTGETNLVAVSPDAGGVARADNFRGRLRAPLAIISKRRATDARHAPAMAHPAKPIAQALLDRPGPSRMLTRQPVYAIPDPLLNAISHRVPGFFAEAELARERSFSGFCRAFHAVAIFTASGCIIRSGTDLPMPTINEALIREMHWEDLPRKEPRRTR